MEKYLKIKKDCRMAEIEGIVSNLKAKFPEDIDLETYCSDEGMEIDIPKKWGFMIERNSLYTPNCIFCNAYVSVKGLNNLSYEDYNEFVTSFNGYDELMPDLLSLVNEDDALNQMVWTWQL